MSRRLPRAVAVLGLSGTLAACNVFFALDDYAGPSDAACSSCAAEQCQCTPTAPAGFDHARLFVAAKVSDLCPSGTLAGVAMGQGAKDTGCACECVSPPSGAACALAVFTGKGCQGTPAQSIASSSCTALTGSGELSAAVVPAAGAACPAQAAPRQAAFGVYVLACLDPVPGAAGCAAGSVCAAAAPAPFDPSPCLVAQPGASPACPQAYSHEYVFATGFDDQRLCDGSACACSPQTCPDTQVTLCQDAACQSNCGLKSQSFTNCKDFAGLTHARVDFAGKTQGTCQPSGEAKASGALGATGTLTVCCRNELAQGP
ncbi:MAG: hypothetical protein IT375_22435 [Polyangiaceae bacterium]|nr:hypothetical protein [Polyangiaceae bacterium]